MTPSEILACYIALASLDLAWGLFLTLLNYRMVARNSGLVPQELVGSLGPEEAAKSTSYSLARMRLSFVQSPILTALVVAAAALGLFGLLDAALGRVVASAYWRGALFLGAVALASEVLAAPFSLYSTFSLEKRFGFNTTKMGTYLADLAKGAALTIALGLPLLYLLYLFIDGTGRLWWLWAGAIFSVISVLISLVYPLVIAPLFNKFSPLPEGSLSTRISELAQRLDFKVSGISVMDGSKRSRHSNAYFTGLGKLKRIVLYDTLVSGTPEDEILAVLAHEIGHAKRRHQLKTTAASIALSFLSFWVMSLLMEWGPLYEAFGFAGSSKHAMLLILSLLSGPATFFFTPLFSAWSRKYEYQADAFAVRATSGEALASALSRLSRENATNLWPHPLYSFWYYSHPSASERLAAIQKASLESA